MRICVLSPGRGRYTDDVILPRMTHAFVLRSSVAHAHIKRIDAAAAPRRLHRLPRRCSGRLGFSANTLSRSNSLADNVMARRYFMVGFLVFSHDIVVSHGVLCLACFDWTGWPDLTVTAAPCLVSALPLCRLRCPLLTRRCSSDGALLSPIRKPEYRSPNPLRCTTLTHV